MKANILILFITLTSTFVSLNTLAKKTLPGSKINFPTVSAVLVAIKKVEEKIQTLKMESAKSLVSEHIYQEARIHDSHADLME